LAVGEGIAHELGALHLSFGAPQSVADIDIGEEIVLRY
jgi:hypothetical protein